MDDLQLRAGCQIDLRANKGERALPLHLYAVLRIEGNLFASAYLLCARRPDNGCLAGTHDEHCLRRGIICDLGEIDVSSDDREKGYETEQHGAFGHMQLVRCR